MQPRDIMADELRPYDPPEQCNNLRCQATSADGELVACEECSAPFCEHCLQLVTVLLDDGTTCTISMCKACLEVN